MEQGQSSKFDTNLSLGKTSNSSLTANGDWLTKYLLNFKLIVACDRLCVQYKDPSSSEDWESKKILKYINSVSVVLVRTTGNLEISLQKPDT